MSITDITTARPSRTRALHEGWSLRAVGGAIPESFSDASIPAIVPGLVHTDLLAAGLIPDPFLDRNEHKVTWIGSTDWEYRTTFDWAPDGHDRHDLVFDGLDTVARVTVNGEVIAETRNQHRTYRIDVTRLLREGENTLVVHFESPVAAADRASLEIGYRPHTYFHPFNALRKAACNFGWDWGLDAASAGIWKPVSLHSWSVARIAAVRPVVTVAGSEGRVSVHVDVERSRPDAPIALLATVAGVERTLELSAGETSGMLDLSVADADLWWPRGYGEQPLYDLKVALLEGGEQIGDWSSRIGFRTIRVELEPDAEGTSFRFVVNGVPLWIRGANWIPDDAFVTRVDRDRLSRRLDQAEFANMNLLRIWGGGYYESDDFYELCDERGILVWQDFLFACAAYAEEEPLWNEVEAEARDNITRIMPHPSLALWNGNNENIWGFEEWGWEKRVQGRTWGMGYYLDLLPGLVAELDPAGNYTAGSPWSGTPEIPANDPDHGSVHLWELWNRVDYPAYRDVSPRFVAEFGWQGPATWSTIQRAISDSPLTPESPGMIHHQKATDGNDKLTDGLVAHLPLPDDTEDWHWAMSLNQANAVTVAIEHFRSLSPRCMGSVVWQLNDCWPVTSWAAVDGDERAKPLLYALRHVYADRLVTVQPRGERLVVAVLNDSPEALDGDLVIRRLRFDGTELASATVPLSLERRSSTEVDVPERVAQVGSARDELIVATIGGDRGFWYFSEARDSNIPAPSFHAEVRRDDEGYAVSVHADSFLRDLTLLVDKVAPDAVVDDQLVTLLPGEDVIFHVRSASEIDGEALLSTRVIRTANQLVEDWSR